MNSISEAVLRQLFKKCNRPTGLILSVSVNVTEVRFKHYHQAGVSDRLKAHDELASIQASVPGFKLHFFTAGFDDVPLLKRIDVGDTKRLLAYCGESVRNDEAQLGVVCLRAAGLSLPAWALESINDAETTWLQGKRFLGCTPETADRVLDALRFVEWLDQQGDSGVQTDIRTVSVQLYGHSKRLELLIPIIANLYKPRTPEALHSSKPEQILAYWGVSKFPPSFRIKGDITVVTQNGELNAGAAWPYIQIPPDGIRALHSGSSPSYIMFIENKTTYERYTREILDQGWVFYTNGFPSRHWQELFKRIVSMVGRGTPVYHWGDIDIGGYKILSFMAALLQRNIIPFMMDKFDSEPGGKRVPLAALADLTAGFDGAPIGELHRRVQAQILRGGDVKRIEQESLTMVSPHMEEITLPIRYKSVSVQQPSGFTCDRCKTSFEHMDASVRVQHTFGYHAPKGWDGEAVDVVLCEKCLLELVSQFSGEELKRARIQREKQIQETREAFRDSANIFGFSASDAENHPDNGKQGFWKVEGVRHSALVQTDSAVKAIDLSSDAVGDWELCDVKYLGATLPTVFNV